MCGKTGAVVVALFATEKVYGDLIKGFATTSIETANGERHFLLMVG